MKPLPLKFSDRFYQQVANIADFYDREAGENTAKRFLQALKTTLDHVAENPGIGSVYEPVLHQKSFGNIPFYKAYLTTYSSFPYTIFYRIEKHCTMIHVIHHQSANHDTLFDNI